MKLFYRDDMVPADVPGNYSKSPTKPRRFLEFLRQTPMWQHIELRDDFGPISRDQLLLAHEPGYVNAFLTGTPRHLAESNGLAWTPPFRDSVLLTNSSLLTAITAAVENPAQVMMAPVSGFHHATPGAGQGFCTFSGQVIAALKLYRERGLRGAWVDLDGHFGNSIEDSRAFAPDLSDAIPVWANINPRGVGSVYLSDLSQQMYNLRYRIGRGDVDYVCVAHGADSHEWDQLGHQCSTAEWLRASEIVYEMLQVSPRPDGVRVPVTLALFGGYRDDHPESVLGLHAMDTAIAISTLENIPGLADYQAEVRKPAR